MSPVMELGGVEEHPDFCIDCCGGKGLLDKRYGFAKHVPVEDDVVGIARYIYHLAIGKAFGEFCSKDIAVHHVRYDHIGKQQLNRLRMVFLRP